MYRDHFGITDAPLGKKTKTLWDDGQLAHIKTRFQWLLDNPGIGVLTGDVGVGKTSVLRQLVSPLNPHRYQVIYLSETDFGRVDLYRSLALALGLEPAFRRAQVWRDIKARIQELKETFFRAALIVTQQTMHGIDKEQALVYQGRRQQ